MWSSSSIPTEAAWAVLKRDDMDSLPPELESQMQSFYEQIPDEQREKIEQLGQAVETMDPETKRTIKTMLLQTVMHNSNKMPDILQSADPSNLFGPQETEPGTFKVDSGPVKKAFFVPLVIAAVFAADGINQSQGAKASIVGNGLLHTGAALGLFDPPKTSAFDYDSGVASFQDPFLGVELGRVENPSWWQRAGAATLGAAQGLSFGAVTLKPLRSAISSKRATRAAGKAEKIGDKISAIPEGRKGLRGMGDKYKKRKLTEQQTRLQDKSKKLADRAAKPSSQALGTARRLGQATLGDPRAKPALGALFAGALSGNTPNISGTASATPSAGGGGTGVGGVGNRASAGLADQKIFDGRLEVERLKAGAGGYGTNKGDNMKIGEQILKEVDLRIHKAHCMGDTEKKGDKKGGKKPAHGMIIVLGAQGSGPGPSKDGKRVKKK